MFLLIFLLSLNLKTFSGAKEQQKEELEVLRKMTGDPEQCMELLLKWRGMDYTTLGAEIDRDPKTISRNVKSKTFPKVETAVLICLGLHLPPMISQKLLEAFGCQLNPLRNKDHQWISEALNVKYADSVDVAREYLEPYGIEL